MGYIGWIGRNLGVSDPKDTHKVESQITKELLHQGAVLYCKVCLSMHATKLLEKLTNPTLDQFTSDPACKFMMSIFTGLYPKLMLYFSLEKQLTI